MIPYKIPFKNKISVTTSKQDLQKLQEQFKSVHWAQRDQQQIQQQFNKAGKRLGYITVNVKTLKHGNFPIVIHPYSLAYDLVRKIQGKITTKLPYLIIATPEKVVHPAETLAQAGIIDGSTVDALPRSINSLVPFKDIEAALKRKNDIVGLEQNKTKMDAYISKLAKRIGKYNSKDLATIMDELKDQDLYAFYQIISNEPIEISGPLIEISDQLLTMVHWIDSPLFDCKYPQVAELLIAKGVHANDFDDYGASPLHYVIDEQVAKVLLDHGAQVNARDDIGNTPLHNAKTIQLARYLISRGADVNTKNFNGDKPLDKIKKSQPDNHPLISYLQAITVDFDEMEQFASFKCPLSLSVYQDPIVASDGFSYQSRDFNHLIQNSIHNGTPLVSPMTREPIQSVTFPNRTLKTILQELKQKKTRQLRQKY